MPSFKLSVLAILLVLTTPAFGEEKAENSTVPSITKTQKEFIDKRSRLNSLTNRISEYRKNFNAAVISKNRAQSPQEKKRWIDAMNEIHRQMNKDIETFNQLKSELKLRFPAEGELLDRQYKTQGKKSVEELEGAVGLDEKLTHAKRTIDKKYEPFLIEEEKSKKIAPAVSRTEEEEKPKRLRLEK